MKKISLFSVAFMMATGGIAAPNNFKTGVKQNLVTTNSITSKLPSYGLIKFKKLPDPEELLAKQIIPINYVDQHTIYAHVRKVENLKKISDFEKFEALPYDVKIDKNIKQQIKDGENKALTVFIYLPSDFSNEQVYHFCNDKNISPQRSESLPTHVIMVNLQPQQIKEIANSQYVSWISEAPSYAREGKLFHFCNGALTPYGPKGEFSRYATNGPGWDGSGLGCADLTYFFENGTPDIAGTLEQAEVIRALRVWEKYVQINFTEGTSANQTDAIDISWEFGDHGDGSSFDGTGGVLAHAFYPNPPNPESIAGDLHFDEAEAWSLSGGTHLFSVALHEIGHSLGLAHSGVSGAVMYPTYSLGTEFTDLHADDIAGIQSLYNYRSINEDEWDRIFVGNVTGNDNKEIVMVNASYNGGAIRVDNMETGANLLWINHCDLQGWLDNSDKAFLGDANGDGLKDLILINTDYIEGAIRAIDLTTGSNISWILHGAYNGWMDATDKMFIGNVNSSAADELILVNTSYSGGAIRAVNLTTGSTVSQLNHGTYGGWMDASDRMLTGDANGDNEDDLILINTSYTGGAIRSIDITSGANWGWLNHTGTYNSWMDATDKVAVADMDNDNSDELILINTSYSGGAIRALNLQTGSNKALHNHGSYGGWMGSCDRMFIADANNDNKEDLILVNTGYSGGAIRAIDIASNTNISLLYHDGSYSSWMDGTDRMYCEDINDDGNAELVILNTSYVAGAIRPITVLTGANLSWLTHDAGFYNGWMDGFSNDQNCYTLPVFKSDNLDASVAPHNLEEEQNEISLLIYPNPSHDIITVELPVKNTEIINASVLNMQGQKIKQLTFNNTKNVVDLGDLNTGTYFVEFTYQNKIYRQNIQVIR